MGCEEGKAHGKQEVEKSAGSKLKNKQLKIWRFKTSNQASGKRGLKKYYLVLVFLTFDKKDQHRDFLSSGLTD